MKLRTATNDEINRGTGNFNQLRLPGCPSSNPEQHRANHKNVSVNSTPKPQQKEKKNNQTYSQIAFAFGSYGDRNGNAIVVYSYPIVWCDVSEQWIAKQTPPEQFS